MRGAGSVDVMGRLYEASPRRHRCRAHPPEQAADHAPDTDAVLAELGDSEEQITELRTGGAIT